MLAVLEINKMNKIIIIIKNADGSCGVMYPMLEMFDPVSRTRKLLRSNEIDFETDEEVLNWIINNDVPTYRKLMIDGETEEEAKSRLSVDDLDQKVQYRITEKSNLPESRDFRNAWTDDNPTETVDVNMEKARGIHLNKLRELRKPKLDALDKEYMKADEMSNTAKKVEIAAKKQALRDIPQTLDLSIAQTPDELKAIIPLELQ
jgi:hypothetical protein